jgi:GntP family gluconate:H+ symporter
MARPGACSNDHDLNPSLLFYALAAVVGLIVLIARFKLNSFIALIVASLFIGVASGMELRAIATAFQDGTGAVLGSIAAVVGLGIILGKMLDVSGGAGVVASTLIRAFGRHRLPSAILAVALIVGLPVFFTVGLVLLVPILFAVARETRSPLLPLGIPLLAGLSVMHGLVPPHPGPMVAADMFRADIGLTILYSLLVGIPTGIVAGPVFGAFIARRVVVSVPEAREPAASRRQRRPGFGLTLVTIVLPVALMLLATLADVLLPPDDRVRQIADFAGHPIVALVVAVLFSFYSFGAACGFDRNEILEFSSECLAPAATILLVVGAGGGFNRVLVTSGVGRAIAELATGSHVPILLLGWLVAALIRLATGSATVAITTAAGIIAPVAAATVVNAELLVLAMGAGSLIASHVNDAGFWFVKEYFGMTVTQTLKTWTVMETVIAVVALAFVLLLDVVV